MAYSEDMLAEDLDPIDLVETLAEHREWDFDRIAENQIAMTVEGQWRTYALTLAWSGRDETLRLVCSFEMTPPDERRADLLALINRINDETWTGAFCLWEDRNIMVWRYGLVLAGGQTASAAQIDRMIASAVSECERFYPAFQLIGWSNTDVDGAMRIAITEAYGRA